MTEKGRFKNLILLDSSSWIAIFRIFLFKSKSIDQFYELRLSPKHFHHAEHVFSSNSKKSTLTYAAKIQSSRILIFPQKGLFFITSDIKKSSEHHSLRFNMASKAIILASKAIQHFCKSILYICCKE